MLASAEARRNNALHEIDLHRSALGAAVRQAVEVEDVEFRDVEGWRQCQSQHWPKARAGKARSARNALRHSLYIRVWSDPALAPQAEAIALVIAGPNADAETLDYARQISEAQVDLNRVARKSLRASCLTLAPTANSPH